MKFISKYTVLRITILILFVFYMGINGCRLTQKQTEEIHYQDKLTWKPIETTANVKYASGTKTIKLIGSYDILPTWSPDGKSIFVLSSQSIFSMDTRTWNIERIKSNFSFDVDMNLSGLSISPDGKKIAIVKVSEHPATRDIYILNIEDNSIRKLTSAKSNSYNPSWSSDGKTIVFVAERDGYAHIYLMDETGKLLKKLTNGKSDNTKPVFSKDGSKIAFVSFRDGNAEIYMMNSDGSDQRNLTNNPATDIDPNWSPNSQKIVFSSNRSGNYDLYSVDINSFNLERLTQDSAQEVSPSWSPDGDSIVYLLYHSSL